MVANSQKRLQPFLTVSHHCLVSCISDGVTTTYCTEIPVSKLSAASLSLLRHRLNTTMGTVNILVLPHTAMYHKNNFHQTTQTIQNFQ